MENMVFINLPTSISALLETKVSVKRIEVNTNTGGVSPWLGCWIGDVARSIVLNSAGFTVVNPRQ